MSFSLNWSPDISPCFVLHGRKVKYLNMKGSLVDGHTVKGETARGKEVKYLSHVCAQMVCLILPRALSVPVHITKVVSMQQRHVTSWPAVWRLVSELTDPLNNWCPLCLQTILTARNIVIATGGRPKYPTHVSARATSKGTSLYLSFFVSVCLFFLLPLSISVPVLLFASVSVCLSLSLSP